VLIRTATSADVADLASLVKQYWEFEAIDGFDRSRIEALLGDLLSEPERGAIWIAQDGMICGYLTVVYAFSLEHGGLMAEIDEIYVSPEARSAGVGSLLVTRAENDLKNRGLTRLQLQLGTGNDRGRRFYERHGFRRRVEYELLDKPLYRARGKLE